jgi:hypothetical protein
MASYIIERVSYTLTQGRHGKLRVALERGVSGHRNYASKMTPRVQHKKAEQIWAGVSKVCLGFRNEADRAAELGG